MTVSFITAELKYELQGLGGLCLRHAAIRKFLLRAYDYYGPACAEKLNGIYAFAVDDEQRSPDIPLSGRFGVEPLVFYRGQRKACFCLDQKALFEYPGLNPVPRA